MITYNVEDVEIPFDPSWKAIAISLSGGADSALLAHLLCDIIMKENANTEIHIISHVRMWKTRPWQGYDSKRIFDWLSKKFTNIKFTRHENFIPPAMEWYNTAYIIKDEYGKMTAGDIIELQSYAEYVCFHNNIDAYYNAVTKNPKNVDFKGMDKRDVEPTEDNQHLRLMIHMEKIASHPFRFTEKSWVIKQYRRLNLMDLFDITRSCAGEVKDLDYRSYKYGQEVPTCNECFWCKERAWAVEQSK